ncbi:MAG: DEAD/DEAH box helicase [Candidatus Methylumidiphilus sp.]
MPLSHFHPAVAAWFSAAFPGPTAAQAQAWAAIKDGRHTLISAPTGSGKTLAAFLSAIDDLVKLGVARRLAAVTQVLYISPLKALGNDIQKNLQQPLEGINRKLFELGFSDVALSSMVRSGDTPATARAAMLKNPPHILVTTPESAYLLLTSVGGRKLLKTVNTVIVDEIHALLASKRGAHLALSLERLTGGRLHRIGLSATQNPIEDVARFLVGCPAPPRLGEVFSTAQTLSLGEKAYAENCQIIDTGHLRRLDLGIELPDSPLEAVLSNDAAASIYIDRGAPDDLGVRQHPAHGRAAGAGLE